MEDKRPWAYQVGLWSWSAPYASREEAERDMRPPIIFGKPATFFALSRVTPTQPPWLLPSAILTALQNASDEILGAGNIDASSLSPADMESLAFVVNAAVSKWASQPGREGLFVGYADIEQIPLGNTTD